jgi:outer membrane protein insertion porin family
MPKRSIRILCALAALFLLVLAPRPFWAQAPRGAKILVLPFEVNASSELGYLKAGLPQLLRDRLQAMGFELISFAKMDEAIRTLSSEYLDIQTAQDLALQTGAEFAVYGSFSQAGEAISVDARLVDAFGLKPVKPIYVAKQGLINVLPAVDELAEKIRLELLSKDVIAEVAVRGDKYIDKEVILMRLTVQKGDIYDPAKADKDLRRIFDLGYYEDVQVALEDVPGGKRIVYIVTEKPRIGAIDVEGNDELDDDDITEVMTTKTDSVLNPSILAEDLNKIRELYRKDGYYKADVRYEVEAPAGQQARLVIYVNEGRKLYIRQIAIEGAKELEPDDIKSDLALTERGLFSWITGSGVLKEELLERDTAVIEAYYANRGFLQATVGKPQVEFRDDGIYITYQVSEGPRYTVSQVGFSGDMLVPEDILRARIKLDDIAEKGGYLDRSVMREDMQRLNEFYMDYGYAFADTNVDVKPDPAAKTVAVTYILDKNQKVYIRRVIVEGNTKTRTNVILREMRLGDGDLFSGSQIARSNERLVKLDFFELADVETVPTGRDSELDLKVKVKEKPTGMLSAGTGYSTYSKVFVSASIQERNLFGKGYNLGLTSSFSSKDTAYTLSFTNPHVYDTTLSAGFDLYKTDVEYLSYDKETTGGRLRFGWPLGEYTRSTISYRLDKYIIDEIEDDAANQIKELEGENWSSVAGLTLRRDTTNRVFNPSRGTDSALYLEYGGGLIGGDDNFIKWVADYNYYYGLWWDTVFHLRTAVGMVYQNLSDERVPAFERFYLGGINSVRGYEGRHISPRDTATDDFIGGDKEFIANLEYVFPVKEDFGLLGVLFFDAGNAWNDDEFFFEQADSSEEHLTLGLYKSVGLGIRWLSPIGPLRLEYGYPLDKLKDSSENGRFEFALGTTF